MDKYIGKLLDNRYEMLEILGVGGMAVVYKARDRVLDRFVAIKIMKEEFSNDEEFHRRFRNESQAVAKLSHNNIVSIFDVSPSNSPVHRYGADRGYHAQELLAAQGQSVLARNAVFCTADLQGTLSRAQPRYHPSGHQAA